MTGLQEDLMRGIREGDAPAVEDEIEEMLAPLAARREQLAEEQRQVEEYGRQLGAAVGRIDAILKAGTTPKKKQRRAAPASTNGKWEERLEAVLKVVRESDEELTTREVAALVPDVSQTYVSKILSQLHREGRIRKVAERPTETGKGRTPVWAAWEESHVPA